MTDNPEKESENLSWVDEALDAHAEKIGHVVMAWARMQEHLGQLFAYLVSPHHLTRGWTVWHTIQSDTFQRNLLGTLVKQIYPDKRDPMRIEILWILAGAQEIMDDRNGAVHVAFHLGIDLEASNVRMYPIIDTGNPRALQLAGRDLAADFDFTVARVTRLGLHSKALAPHLEPLATATGPLPQRPPAPVRRPSTTQTDQGSGA